MMIIHNLVIIKLVITRGTVWYCNVSLVLTLRSFKNIRDNITEEDCAEATAEGDVTAFMNKAIDGQEQILSADVCNKWTLAFLSSKDETKYASIMVSNTHGTFGVSIIYINVYYSISNMCISNQFNVRNGYITDNTSDASPEWNICRICFILLPHLACFLACSSQFE